MLIFFDTEFTELGIDPRLISIGLVSEVGDRTFYAELSDTYMPADCGDFARLAMLPKLEAGKALMTFDELNAPSPAAYAGIARSTMQRRTGWVGWQ